MEVEEKKSSPKKENNTSAKIIRTLVNHRLPIPMIIDNEIPLKAPIGQAYRDAKKEILFQSRLTCIVQPQKL